MSTKKYPMTPAGKKKLEAELAYLKDEKQKQLNEQIKEHRGYCDFSENPLFGQTLDQQATVKDRISRIEEMLLNSQLINSKDKETMTVELGSTVTFIELPDGVEETYIIVGPIEANPLKHKISVESPVGKSLQGHKKGDVIVTDTPSGEMKIKIVAVS